MLIKKGNYFRDAQRQKIKRITERILDVAKIVGRAVLFVIIVLAFELACIGIAYLACGR